eukprot:gene5869-11856_t
MISADDFAPNDFNNIDYSLFVPEIHRQQSEKIGAIRQTNSTPKKKNYLTLSSSNTQFDDLSGNKPTIEDYQLNHRAYFTPVPKRPPLAVQSAGFRTEDQQAKSRSLRLRLKERPYDRRALTQLSELLYQQKDYVTAAHMIKRAMACGEDAGSLHIKLARCYLYQWYIDGKRGEKELPLALQSYRKGLRDPAIASPTLCNPALYMELAVVQLRTGHQQAALDVLGVCLVLTRQQQQQSSNDSNDAKYKDNWSVVCQYAIALIMFAHGRTDDALQVYQRLLAMPLVVEAEQDSTAPSFSPPLLPIRIHNLYVQMEAARCYELSGKTQLAGALYTETWHRMNKTHGTGTGSGANNGIIPGDGDGDGDGDQPPSRQGSRTGSRCSSRGDSRGGSRCGSKDAEDEEKTGQAQGLGLGQSQGRTSRDSSLRCGASSQQDWRSNPEVLCRLGFLFRREGNIPFAADFFLQAWESQLLIADGHFESLERYQQENGINLLLLRAECLFEIGIHEEAETCAELAVHLSNDIGGDAVVLGRAALCCRPDSRDPQVRTVLEEGLAVLHAVKSTQFNSIISFSISL